MKKIKNEIPDKININSIEKNFFIVLAMTISIVLIFIAITIVTPRGKNELLPHVTQAKQADTESKMKEQLTLAIQDLKTEKEGKATLDDITQEWISEKIQEYKCTIKDDVTISGKKVIMEKDNIAEEFIIDEKLDITEIENNLKINYEVITKNGENIELLLIIEDNENGINRVEFPDGNIIYCNGNKKVAKDYTVQLGVENKIKIISQDGQEKEETVLIKDYYYQITKNLGEGISIDNAAVKAAYNKPYQAKIIEEEGYIIDTISVTMGGQEVAVDKETGNINIEKVTGDIKITATATAKLEIQTTTPIVNTDANATSSLGASTQTRGTTLYINFKATVGETNCTIEPEVPYAVTSNGKYKFTATYQNKKITKEIEVTVNQYQTAQGLVQYDAGDWTEEEINNMKNSKLYDLNASHIIGDKTFKLNSDSGLNFTFGGFTYKGDTANESNINSGAVITSRNKSVSPQSRYGTPKYEGWQVLESKEENGKTYVTKLVHAGTPENFVYYCTTSGDANRAEYLLSNGERQTGYKALSNGTTINPRNWDMYKDKELDKKGYIKEVHAMTYSEASAASINIIRTGSYYWLGSAQYSGLRSVITTGSVSGGFNYCWGVRPVVSLESGVYIESGDGTEENPYILSIIFENVLKFFIY